MAERMIERIASMIQQMHGEPGQTWEEFADTAYAVVRDLRSPTAKMTCAGDGKSGIDAWTAMLDVVLADHADLGSPAADPDAERIESHRVPVPHEPVGTSGP